jgi:phospholipase/carboxylesterase
MRFALVVCAALLAACASEDARPGRLTARPHQHNAVIAMRGELPLGGSSGARDGRIYVPTRPRASYPLMLLLHGAHGEGERIERRMQQFAEEFGFIILAPDSRGMTWDVGHGALGADVEFIDRALKGVFVRYPIDTAHMAIAGFSDGASYALTVGVINGDLFTHVIAFSPGYIATNYGRGKPPIFIAHGTADEILDFDQTSRVFVPGLRHDGYRVIFRTFDGPHTIPPEVAREAARWWLSGAVPAGAAD